MNSWLYRLKTDFVTLTKVTRETFSKFLHQPVSAQHLVTKQITRAHHDVTGSEICTEHKFLIAFATKMTAKLLVVIHFEYKCPDIRKNLSRDITTFNTNRDIITFNTNRDITTFNTNRDSHLTQTVT